MSENRHSHLRLVKPTLKQPKDSASSHRIRVRDRQLNLPYPQASTVFFVYVDSLRSDEFARMIDDYIPRWIIDVRTVPRLDTISASRTSAFDLFEKTKVVYIDLFGRLGIKSYRSAESNPAFWGTAVYELLKASERRGPYFFLFDDEQQMTVARNLLQDIIEPIIGKDLSFLRLPTRSTGDA